MALFQRFSKRKPVKATRSQTLVRAQADLGFDYILKCSSRRRSVAITIKATEVSVSAPLGVSERDLQKWLVSKREWVLAKLQVQSQRADEVPVRHYQTGALVPYLGAEYPLTVLLSARSAVNFSIEQGFVVEVSRRGTAKQEDRVQALLQQWFKTRAKEYLSAKTQLLCQRMDLQVEDVRIRRTKSKWGHCTSKGVIQYNWLILAAPDAIVDYLVAHEVCHLRHHNHSRAFWVLVGSVCPDYLASKNWLQRYSHTLAV